MSAQAFGAYLIMAAFFGALGRHSDPGWWALGVLGVAIVVRGIE